MDGNSLHYFLQLFSKSKISSKQFNFSFFFNLQSTLGLYQKPRSPSQEVLQFCLLWAGGCFCLKVGVGDPRRSVPCRAGALSRVDGPN